MFELKPGILRGLSETEKRKWLELITSEATGFHGSNFSGIQQVNLIDFVYLSWTVCPKKTL